MTSSIASEPLPSPPFLLIDKLKLFIIPKNDYWETVPTVLIGEKIENEHEQAGTGPSRRHIQGSKIAKRLPSVKYSFTVLENRKFFEFFF